MLRGKIFKGALFLWASIAALLCCSVPASALSVSELEQISDDSEAIELAEPEEGYAFDATFLAKNQELSYKATIENDEEFPIRISNITLNESEYNFLEYTFEGLEIGDELEIGDKKEIIVTVKTNNNNTQTVSEDYDLTVDYDLIKFEDNPETSTTAVISTISAAAVGAGAIIFIFSRSKKIRQFAIIFTISSLGICALSFNASATEDTNFSILGKVNFINTYTVTVNPNGGVYDGKTENTVVYRREGESYHVSEATREHFEFVEWEVNPGELDDNNDIEIHADTTIKAKWNENTYTLTIKPNGGEYLGSTEEWSESFRPNEAATISTPELEGYDFVDWTVEEGNVGANGKFTGSSINMVEDVTLVANFEIKQFTVTVIPNGGTYHESTNTFTTTVDWNTDYEIESIAREGYDLKDWTKTIDNTPSTLAANTQSVNIKADTVLEANWWSSTFYTVTIIPNGGVYDNKTEASEYSVREGTDYTMLEATYEGQLFDFWHYTDTETHMDEASFTVTGDVSLTAEWQPIIARIERTQKLYPSIMAAHEEAESGDTITLLVDTSEIVTNSKNVTLDLNTHTVSGYLVNTENGNLLLVNGEFNNYANPVKDETNPYGAAAINNGTLTLGYDDYTDNDNYNKAPLIDNDYVRLVGDERGLIQNNIFYFYDGHIDGDLGLVGGYDGSPWYRDTDSPDHEDTQEVHYYPHVSRLTRDEASFQRVQLANSNRAVSRTIDHGAIYYYELQDNIDMSAVTGYTIYAARNFDGSNPTEIASGDTIVFDTDGYKVDLGGTFTNNGTLTIKDGKTGEAKGELTTSKTIENNGSLTIQDITITGTQETLLHNSDTVELENSKLITNSSITYEVLHSDEQLIMDEDSLIESTNSNYPALKLKANFEVNSGYFKAADCAVSVDRGYNFTFGGGLITSDATAVCVLDSDSLTTINGGKIYSNGTNTNGIRSTYSPVNFNDGEVEVIASSSANGITSSNLEMKGGSVVVRSDGNATGIYGSATITKGTVTVTATDSGTASGTSNGTFNINGDGVVISATSADGPAYGSTGSITITNGTVSASSTNGVAYGNYSDGAQIVLNGENAKLLAHSINNVAQGTATYDWESYWSGWHAGTVNLYISAGEISAIADDDTKMGLGIEVSSGELLGGRIYGSTYGAHYNRRGTRGATITLGKNEAPLYNGEADPETSVVYEAKPQIEGGKYGVFDMEVINFYDGMISGGINYIKSEEAIKAIPDGTRLNKERDENDVENCWLKYEEPYLLLEDGSRWRSLGDAYEHVGDEETITVIRDMSTQAVLPNNAKNITIDLNGFKLEYTQPLANTGSLTFVDGDTENHRGEIINRNSTLIDNDGSLEIRSGTFTGGDCTVNNKSGRTFDMKGGSLSSTATTVCNDTNGIVNMTGGSITANGSSAYGINGGVINISTGSIEATGSSGSQAVSARVGKITGGTIKAIGTGDAGVTAVGLSETPSYVNGSTVKIDAVAESGTANAIATYYGFTFTEGQATAKSTNGEAWGIYASGDATVEINGTNAKLTVESTNNNARGSYTFAYESFWSGWHYGTLTINMSAGDVHVETKNTDRMGIGFDATTMNVTGGKVYGSTYGLSYTRSSREAVATLGKNEAPLYNGEADPDTSVVYEAKPQIEGGKYGNNNVSVYFYDGMISGGIEYVLNTNTIKAIPDGTYQNINTREDGQDSWLRYDEPYLELEDGSRYRSLGDAYEHVGNNETITVIRDMSTQAVLPNNDKNITIDLNGHKVSYSQPIRNSGTLKIVDGDTEHHRGSIENTITNAIYNTGTLEIDSGTISGKECVVNNDHQDAIFTLNNGSIEASKIAICNSGTVNINDGTVKAEGETVMGVRNYGTLNMTDGEVTIISSGGNNASYGIYSGYDNITGGEITATGTGSASVYGVLASSTTASLVKNTDITVTAENGTASGVASGSATLTVDSSTISSTSTNGLALGYHYDGCSTSYFNIKGNTTITVDSTNNDAKGTKAEICYGLWSTDYGIINFTMESGELSVTTHAENRVGVGVEARSVVVKGGSIYGSTYGIDYSVNSSNVTLGIKDDALSNNNPVIEGGSGRGINSFTNMYFYDGRVKGNSEAISNIRHIRDAAVDVNLYDEKSGDVDTKYLVPAENIARIGDGDCDTQGVKCYKTIQAAVEDSSENDTITLLGDDYLFYYLTLPEGKKFTLDLDGHKIVTGNKITNYSDFTLTNNGADVTVDYVEGDYFITNKSGAKFTLDKVKLSTAPAINSEANTSLTIKDSTINSTNDAISSNGSLTVSGSTITADYAGIREYGNQITISNSTIQSKTYNSNNCSLCLESATGSITGSTLETNGGNNRPAYSQTGSSEIDMNNVTVHGLLQNQSGTVRIKDSEISTDAEMSEYTLISNSGTMSISGESTIANNASYENSNYSYDYVAISNSGSLTIDGATISRIDSYNNGKTNTGIVSSGSLTIADSDVTVSGAWSTKGVVITGGEFNSIGTDYTVSGGVAYGMNVSNGATLNLFDGDLNVSGSSARGINIENGIVTLGEAEQDPAKRGTANADVSTTNPLVKAIGTNDGYALVFDQGDLNYYDGKLVQNEQGFPAYKPGLTEKATITNKEYWYEPQAAQDGDGHYYYILTYMPEG